CFLRAEDGIRDFHVTGVQTCALPISAESADLHATAPGSSGVAAAVGAARTIRPPRRAAPRGRGSTTACRSPFAAPSHSSARARRDRKSVVRARAYSGAVAGASETVQI